MNKKNVVITIISVLILTCIFAFARTTTTDLGLVKPTWTEEIDILDDLNANTDILEAFANDPLEYDSDLERLEDRAGAMWTGNTETGLTITYQDADNTIDAVIGVDDIVETMLKFVNLPADEDIFTYESTTGDFEWHTLAELSIQPLDAGLTSIAGLTTAASTLIYTTALDTYAVLGANATATNKWLRQVNSSAPSWEVIADGDVPNDITIDLATLATTFTCTDNESEALACPIVFVDGATGAQGAETDDTDFTYNPSTGALTAKMHRVYMTSESTALNAGWFQIGSTAVTGDLTGLRAVMQSDAVSGGDAASGLNVRGLYGQAVVAAGDHAGLLQGVLGVADMSAGGATVYNVHAGGSHYSSGASNTIGGDLYVHLMRSQTRSTNSRSVVGHDVILGIENEAIEGTGMTIDSAIRIFGTNTGVDDFTYGIDLDDAVLTTDMRLSYAHTIIDSATGIAISLLSPTTISGLSDVTSTDADYILVWDATDSVLKKVDMGEVRGTGGFTTFSQFDEETAWRIYYSDGSGDITELALGADGTYLGSNGAAAAPTFKVPAGAGDVVKVGTPADSQVGVWTGDGTIEGAASLTYDGANLQLTGDIGSTGTKITKGWFTDLLVTNAIAGSITGNARGLVSVANGDITIQPNGTGDTRIYAPADVVTTKTGVATLTVAEAGTVLVSAAAAYTLTLPTAVGHSGLRYHFIKTDANYNLITLDGNAAETLNYENSTGTPNLTYARLNTYCAEVTVVSDGSNWQVINEAMGQVPECKVYLNAAQNNLTNETIIKINLDVEVYDIGSNFNTTTHYFTTPIAGRYFLEAYTTYSSTVADHSYYASFEKNDVSLLALSQTVSTSVYASPICLAICDLSANDTIKSIAWHDAGNNNVDLMTGVNRTTLIIRLLSKD